MQTVVTWEAIRKLARERYETRFAEPFDDTAARYLEAYRVTREHDMKTEDEARAVFARINEATRSAIAFIDKQDPGDVDGGIVTQGLIAVRPPVAALVDLLHQIGAQAKTTRLAARRDWAGFTDHVRRIYSNGGTVVLSDAEIAMLHVLAGYEELCETDLARCKTPGDGLARLRRRVTAARAKRG